MNLEQLELKPTDGEQYLAVANGNYFYIGPLLYEIAVRAKSLRSPVEIVEDLKRDLAINIDINQVQTALDSIEKNINPAGDADGKAPPRQRSNYIHFKIKLLGGELLDRLTVSLAFLFNTRVAAILTAISVVATAGYYLFGTQPEVSLTGRELVSAYVVLFGIFFIHELGHATATKYYGMKPHEVSFGFYLVFPVFFADVSEAWSLNKKKRIVINLGGVYFQAIINAILVGCTLIYPNSSILTTLLYTNIFVIAYSLMPFFRYDGYWIYSDFFNLPNLMGRSIIYPYRLWKLHNAGQPEEVNRPLLVYSLSSYLFFFVMFYFIGRYVTKSIVHVYGEMGSNNLDWGQFFSEMPYSFYFRIVVILFMTSFLTYRLFRYGRKKFIENF
jgi:putative peptide zinc metalloprotease protein